MYRGYREEGKLIKQKWGDFKLEEERGGGLLVYPFIGKNREFSTEKGKLVTVKKRNGLSTTR